MPAFRHGMTVLIALVAAGTFAVIAPAAADPGSAGQRPEPGFYFGRIAFEDDVIGVALSRTRRVKILVTDAQPGGDAEWFEGRLRGLSLELRSASRRARLRATFDPAQHVITGSIDLPNGKTRALAADLAGEGADLYDVRVRRGRYTGRSTQGHRLEARQEGDFVAGEIRERAGKRRPFRVMDLSRAFEYSIQGGHADRYTVIVSRNATLHYGRSGGVRRGRPGPNLIALDIQPSEKPTPGFFFGKVGFERDVIGVKIDPPDDEGVRRLRAYMSDSEPGGDVQWFTGSLDGNVANFVSASGDAFLAATAEDDLVAGVVVLPGLRVRRFFALPAGEGAGIYEVTVNPDGTIVGTSEEGGTLEATQDGIFVHLVITAPDGTRFESHPNDLTRALEYPVLGNQPDTYLAIVAPRGRFVFGRSGAVRLGSPGLNIIGLDKAC